MDDFKYEMRAEVEYAGVAGDSPSERAIGIGISGQGVVGPLQGKYFRSGSV